MRKVDEFGNEIKPIAANVKIAELGVDLLSAGIGNIHGIYPANWKELSSKRLDEIHYTINKIPLGLHGGTGIPVDQVKKAINMGVYKLNVGTEL